LVLLAGISLIAYNQWLPRYSEAKKLGEATAAIDTAKKSEQEAIQRAEEFEAKFNQKIKDTEAAKELAVKESGEKSREEIAKLSEEISKLNESVALYKKQLNQSRAANEKLASVRVENEQLKSKLSVTSDELGRLTGVNDILKIEKAQIEYAHNRDHHPERLNSK
jgi:DNA repair exonuclease SbcCD ATPase subunit